MSKFTASFVLPVVACFSISFAHADVWSPLPSDSRTTAALHTTEPSAKSLAHQSFSAEEYTQYQNTLALCSSNGLLSSARIGFDAKIMNSATSNLLGVLSLDVNAMLERHRAGYISPEASRLMHSPGFRRAVQDCFGDHLSGSIYKNMVTLYQLASEITGTLGGGAVTAMLGTLANKFPIAFRFLVSWRISLELQALLQVLYQEYLAESTPAEKQATLALMQNISGDVDETCKKVLALAYQKKRETAAKLSAPSITLEERQRLLEKLNKLNAAIEKVEKDLQR